MIFHAVQYSQSPACLAQSVKPAEIDDKHRTSPDCCEDEQRFPPIDVLQPIPWFGCPLTLSRHPELAFLDETRLPNVHLASSRSSFAASGTPSVSLETCSGHGRLRGPDPSTST